MKLWSALISWFFSSHVVALEAKSAVKDVSNDDGAATIRKIGKPIRLIVTDVDGTLMGRSGVLFEPNSAGFRLAHLLGIQVAVATGRPSTSVLDLLGEQNMKKMHFSGNPGVYLNGAYVVGPEGEILRDEPVKPEILQHVLRVLEEEGMLASAVGVTEGPLITYEDKNNISKRVHKVHVEGEPEMIAKLRRRLEDELSTSIAFTQSHSRAFEVMTPGFDKGEGLKLLATFLGISWNEVLALGNAENDLSLFAAAGTAVAVADAYDIAKQAADFITVSSQEGALFEVVFQLLRARLDFVSKATRTYALQAPPQLSVVGA